MYAAIQQALVSDVNAAFAAAWPGVPLVTDNAPFDWNAPPERFVTFEVEFYAGAQIGASANPKTRASGFVYAVAYAREGLGVQTALGHLGWLADRLKYRAIGAVRLQGPQIDRGPQVKGWHTRVLRVPFYADET